MARPPSGRDPRLCARNSAFVQLSQPKDPNAKLNFLCQASTKRTQTRNGTYRYESAVRALTFLDRSARRPSDKFVQPLTAFSSGAHTKRANVNALVAHPMFRVSAASLRGHAGCAHRRGIDPCVRPLRTDDRIHADERGGSTRESTLNKVDVGCAAGRWAFVNGWTRVRRPELFDSSRSVGPAFGNRLAAVATHFAVKTRIALIWTLLKGQTD